jgi:hypothetical protein
VIPFRSSKSLLNPSPPKETSREAIVSKEKLKNPIGLEPVNEDGSSPKVKFRKIVQKLQNEKKSISETVGALLQKGPLISGINNLMMRSQNIEKEFNIIFTMFESMGESISVDFAKEIEGDFKNSEEQMINNNVAEKKENPHNFIRRNRGLSLLPITIENNFRARAKTSKSISPLKPLKNGKGDYKEKRVESSIGRLLKMVQEG